MPQALVRSPGNVGTAPVLKSGDSAVLVRDVADVREGTMPGEVDRYNMRRLVGMTASIQGDDLGDVARQVARAVADKISIIE